MLLTWSRKRAGIVRSQPSLHADSRFSVSLFRTMKHRPNYPERPFASLEQTSAAMMAPHDRSRHERIAIPHKRPQGGRRR